MQWNANTQSCWLSLVLEAPEVSQHLEKLQCFSVLRGEREMSSDGVHGGDDSAKAAIDTSWLPSSPGKDRRGRSSKRRARRYTLSPSIGNNNVMSGVDWNDPEAFPIIHQDENSRSKASRGGSLATPKTELAVFRDGLASTAPSNAQDADLPDPKDVARLLTPEAKDSTPPHPRVLGTIGNREASPMESRGGVRGNQKRSKATGRENVVDSFQTENLEPKRIKPAVSGDGKEGAQSQAVGATIIPEKVSAATSQSRDDAGGNAEPQPPLQPVAKRKSRNSRRRSIVMPSEAQPFVDSELGSDGIGPPAGGTVSAASSEAATKRSTGDRVTEKKVEGMSKGNVDGKAGKINGGHTAAEEFPLSSVNATSCLTIPLAIQRGWKARPGESSRSLVRAYHAAPAGSQRARRIAARLFCLTGYCLLPVTPDDARVLCLAAGDSFDWGLDEEEGPRLVIHPLRRKTREQKRELVMRIKPLFALMDKAAKDEKLAVEMATGIIARKGSSERYRYEDRETGEPVDPSVYKTKYDEHIQAVAASRLRTLRSLRGEPLPSSNSNGNPTKAGNFASSSSAVTAERHRALISKAALYDPNIDSSSTANYLGESSSTNDRGEVADAVNEPEDENVPEPTRPSFGVRGSFPSEAQEAKIPATAEESARSTEMDQVPNERAIRAPAGEPLGTTAGIDVKKPRGRVEYSEEYEGGPDGLSKNTDAADAAEESSSSIRSDLCVHSIALDSASKEASPSNAPNYLEPSTAVSTKLSVLPTEGVDNVNHVQCELVSKADSCRDIGAGKALSQGMSLILKGNDEGSYETIATPRQGEPSGVAPEHDLKKLTRYGSAMPHGGSVVSTDKLGHVMSPPYLSPLAFPVRTHHVADTGQLNEKVRSLRPSAKLAGGIEDFKSGNGSTSYVGKLDDPMARGTVGHSNWADDEDMKECDALEKRLWARWDDALAEYRAGTALLESKRRQRAPTSATFTKEGGALQNAPVSSVPTSVSAEVVPGNERETVATTVPAPPSSGKEESQTREFFSGGIGDIPASPPLPRVSDDDTLASYSPVLALRDLRLVEEAEEERIASPSRPRGGSDDKFLRSKNIKARRRTLAYAFSSHFQVDGGKNREQRKEAGENRILVGGGGDEGGAEGRTTCRLCCKMKCNTMFRPCEHMLCSVCARKLIHAAEQSGEKLTCPWDRQLVNGMCAL